MDSNLLSLDQSLIWHPYTQEKNAPENVFIVKGEGAYLLIMQETDISMLHRVGGRTFTVMHIPICTKTV
jgi:adenosylmethionine-8-amino-7-oxononanoate aminotransferase